MATVGVIGRREPDEPGVRLAGAAELGRPGLAGGRDAGHLRPGRELPPDVALDGLPHRVADRLGVARRR